MADSGSKNIRGGDRLSDLPDSTQLHILSFLPVKQAIRTCVLSHRWRRTWTALPVLHFDLTDLGPNGLDFIDQVLARRDHSSEIRSFSVVSSDAETDRASTWVCYAAAHGVQEMEIKLKELELKLPDSVSFDKLRILDLYNVLSPIDELISRCPVIESFHLTGEVEVANISSPTLKSLCLVLVDAESISVSCPRLERLVLISLLPVSDFQGEMPCLERAQVYWDPDSPSADKVLASLANVNDLTIFCLKLEFSAVKRSPSFFNLRNLRLSGCFHDEYMERLVQLLEHAPNLSFLKLERKPEQTCFCYEERESWKARKLPHKILYHLKEILVLSELEGSICNMEELMNFLYLNTMAMEQITVL